MSFLAILTRLLSGTFIVLTLCAYVAVFGCLEMMPVPSRMHLPGRYLLFLGLWFSLTSAIAGSTPLRVGLTPVFLDDQLRILGAWRQYLELKLEQPVVFIQRGSYREVADALVRGELDVAWLCGLPYVERNARLSLVAAPVYQGFPIYRSYLIVASSETTTNSWSDLSHGVFAFSDPDSNSGNLYPRYAMAQAGIVAETHFRKTFFAHGHRNVVEAVAAGLADAGAVDGYVWETLKRDNPELVAQTRVVARSGTFGFPPIVARSDRPAAENRRLRRVLEGMTDDAEGRQVLELLNLDGFIEVKPSLYQSIEEMARSAGRVP